jgi:hypothetical protein
MHHAHRPGSLKAVLLTLSCLALAFAPTRASADFVATTSDNNGNAATATFLLATHNGDTGIEIIL